MDSNTPLLIDAHQHFWTYDASQYPWITAGSPLHRDWLPRDLEAEQHKTGFAGAIAVQARQSLEESRWLLTMADHFPMIKAVIGWVDLQSAEVESQLAEFASHPKFRGVRHVVQDEEDEHFMLRPAFISGISKLKQFELLYEILIVSHQLPSAIELAKKFPEQPFVLDHIAKPLIASAALSPWREEIRELALLPNVSCKVSGLVTEANCTSWKPGDFRPYLDVVFDAFGHDRLMFGSDWPVCLLAGSYSEVCTLIQEYAKDLSSEAISGLFGGNAHRIYDLNVSAKT